MLTAADIRQMRHSFGQHLELRKAVKMKEDAAVFAAVAAVVAGHKVKPSEYDGKLYKAVTDCVKAFAEVEKVTGEKLSRPRTADEIAAGVDRLSEAVGDMGTIITLAKSFGQRPNDVLEWTYGEVFAALLVDKETSEYERRMMRVRERKWRKK